METMECAALIMINTNKTNVDFPLNRSLIEDSTALEMLCSYAEYKNS